MKTFLHGLLVIGDALSMAHSLEERVPFLDNALVDYALNMPAAYKYDSSRDTSPMDARGRRETRQGKRVLRKAMAGLVPTEILERKKQGFSAPEKSWYRGPNEGYVRDALLAPRTLERGLLKAPYVTKVVEEHATGQKNHRLLLWSLLCLEFWFRIFIDGDKPEEVSVPPHGRGRP
jgi:asparagine synthase (glutamine-hydrolysing)